MINQLPPAPAALGRGCAYLDDLLPQAQGYRLRTAEAAAARVWPPADRALGALDLEVATTAGMLFLSAEEHLSAAGRLVMAPGVIRPVFTVARAVGELSARAHWMLDPAVDRRARVERWLLDELSSLTERRRLGQGWATGVDSVEARLVGQAAAAGIKVVATRRGYQVDSETRPPTTTEVMSDLYGEVGDEFDIGRLLYKATSAVVHGTAYGLMRHVKVVERSGTGLATARVSITVQEEAETVVGALLGYLRAAKHYVELYGVGHDTWTPAVIYAAQEFRGFIPSDQAAN